MPGFARQARGANQPAGIGAFFHSSNARPRGDDCGSISLLISKKNSRSVGLLSVAKILFFCNNVEILFFHVAGNVYICSVKQKRDDAERYS